MIRMGEINELEIVRKSGFGYFLNAKTGKTTDDILLPNSNTLGMELNIGDKVNAFIYRDSKDRLVATLKEPKAKVGDLAYLRIVSVTALGAFADFGLERDMFIPLKEQKYKLETEKEYLLYIYVDKTGRLAATTNIDKYLSTKEDIQLGDEVSGIVYGYQTNNSLMVAVDGQFKGVVLKNEYFNDIKPGDKLTLRVKKIYEDGMIGLTPRNQKLSERNSIQTTILEYLKEHNGVMPFNDKSKPEDIKRVFKSSKNYFKMALGGLMKEGLIEQGDFGTRLK